MRRFLSCCAVFAVVSGPATVGADEAGAHPYTARTHRAPARPLPPEVRYRDPRYMPPRRRQVFAPQNDLIQAYLPRYTEKPIYNEPPSRFPHR